MARKSKFPTDMSALFNSTSGTLAQIAKKTNFLTVLSDIVRQICPDLPQDVWKIANFKANAIVIEVNSAVWSQRLQFERMNICRELSAVTENKFNQIEIKITPFRTKIPEKTIIPNAINTTISARTAAQLLAVAQNAPDSLRKKLEKLAAHAQK
ncbi:MAG: DciA family protein [Cognaticolwellia sp.]